jgi:hypothetical protein
LVQSLAGVRAQATGDARQELLGIQAEANGVCIMIATLATCIETQPLWTGIVLVAVMFFGCVSLWMLEAWLESRIRSRRHQGRKQFPG